MKILMNKTVDGAPEGVHVHTFEEGTEHDLTQTHRSRELAAVFVREGWAVEVGAEKSPEQKAALEKFQAELDAEGARLDASEKAAEAGREARAAAPPAPTPPAAPKSEKRKGK